MRFAHSRSFVKRDKSDSLTVAPFLRATRATLVARAGPDQQNTGCQGWSGSAKHWLPGLIRISKTLVARAGLRRIGSRPDPLSQPAMIIPITGLLGHYAKPPAPHAGAGRGGIPSHGLESCE